MDQPFCARPSTLLYWGASTFYLTCREIICLVQVHPRGELPAARLGKLMLIVYDDLATFVRKIAAEQASARGDFNVARNPTTTARIGANQQPPTPPLVLTAAAKSSPGRSRGRRKSLPQLLPDIT